MLTKQEFEHRIKAFLHDAQEILQKSSQDFMYEIIQKDINIIKNENIDSYEELLNTINDAKFSEEIRSIACWLVARVGDVDSLPMLFLACDDASIRVRQAAVQALSTMAVVVERRILDTTTRLLLSDNSHEVRTASAYALSMLAHQDSLDPLLDVLTNTNENSGVRGMAAEALISLKDRSAIPSLIFSLSDESPEVRFWSSFALGQLGAEEALPELERLAKEDHEEVLGWHKVSQEAADAIEIIINARGKSDFE
ncbi:MAG: HEAT repeat domain-containing protein [Anaerolineae bacterium]|nr:HEAT repeat domain-containing protein [Anaerolineae bacterium]